MTVTLDISLAVTVGSGMSLSPTVLLGLPADLFVALSMVLSLVLPVALFVAMPVDLLAVVGLSVVVDLDLDLVMNLDLNQDRVVAADLAVPMYQPYYSTWTWFWLVATLCTYPWP